MPEIQIVVDGEVKAEFEASDYFINVETPVVWVGDSLVHDGSMQAVLRASSPVSLPRQIVDAALSGEGLSLTKPDL